MPRDHSADFETAIRQEIAHQGLTSYELARQADVAPSVVSRFVARKRSLSLPNASRVCAVLGLRLTVPAGRRSSRRPADVCPVNREPEPE